MKRKLSVEETWRKVMTGVGKKIQTINKQLTAAQKIYPELVEVHKYMVGYIGFLTNRLQRNELRVKPGKDVPSPTPPDYSSYRGPVCEVFGKDSKECACASGNPVLCDSNIIDTDMFSCMDLRKMLADVINQICEINRQYEGVVGYSQKNFTKLRIRLKEALEIQAELMDLGCYEYENVLFLESEIHGYVELWPKVTL